MEKTEKDFDTREDVKMESKGTGRRPRRERNIEVNSTTQPIIEKENTSLPQEGISSDAKPRRRRENAGEIDDIATKKSNSDGWMSFAPADIKKQPEPEENRENLINSANKDKHFQENNDDGIMVIPDLEDDGDSDQRVAHAPRNVARKIPTLAELESDVKASIPKAEGGLDVSILLSALVPQSQLNELDAAWTFDDLLRDVTDELTGMQKIVIATVTKELSTTKLNPVPAPIQITKQKIVIDKRKN